jgi:hypothetical protein
VITDRSTQMSGGTPTFRGKLPSFTTCLRGGWDRFLNVSVRKVLRIDRAEPDLPCLRLLNR